MELGIVRKEDAQAKGLKRFFTGIPCKRGHVAERYSHPSGNGCVVCDRSRERPETYEDRRKAYRKERKEHVAKKNREYRDAHRDALKAYSKKWREENPILHRDIQRKSVAKNPELYKALKRNRKARLKSAEGKHTGAEIRQLFFKQHGKCVYCLNVITLEKKKQNTCHADHVVALTKGGTNWISNIQLTCSSCNLRKNAKDPVLFAQQIGRLI